MDMADVTPRMLSLFISGNSASSQKAKDNLHRLKADDLPEEWQIEVIDVLTDPARAEAARILATPTLSYNHEPRSRRIVGDLSDRARVLEFLGIDARSGDE